MYKIFYEYVQRGLLEKNSLFYLKKLYKKRAQTIFFYYFVKSTTVQGEPGEFGCGTSTFGLRMDFKAREYRDIGFLVAWLASLLLWFILLIVFGASTTSKSTPAPTYYPQTTSEGLPASQVAAIVGKLIGVFLITCTIAIICGYSWMQILFRYAHNVLRFLIGLKLFIIVGIALGNEGGGFLAYGIIILIIFFFMCLYYWCVRYRLKLAAAMIVKQFFFCEKSWNKFILLLYSAWARKSSKTTKQQSCCNF
ncbi:hypothetical protein RFI_14674 [Reticulomyxa filosa]|uniref:Uncharacterized protein n=1 Tax=Reticulomyxa filosa TaxID=46433 RepID=X6N9V4_RETFI|nr:hypothetical protein RFI_14674 [Reticulomyxa filosa]|eukprot:ETO22524.1 hypothetical protein RFI_14674 [Reticulomyxa filosa]